LRNITEEMRHPLKSVGARQVAASTQDAGPDILDAPFQYSSLVGDSADYASSFRTIVCVVQTAMLWRKVVCVYPMPLVREASFCCVRIAICPCSGSADRTVVLRFDNLGESRGRFRVQECLGHETDLIVYCFWSAADRIVWTSTQSPSVFQAAVPVSQRAAPRNFFADAILSCVSVAVCSYSCKWDRAMLELKSALQQRRWRRQEKWYVYWRKKILLFHATLDYTLSIIRRVMWCPRGSAGGGRCM
jgi:hypothetical protein